MATAKTASKKQLVLRQGDMGSIGMGEWTTKEMRRGKSGAGTSHGRGTVRVVKPPEGGWSGGEPGKNGSKR
jgi:hypothetical protein